MGNIIKKGSLYNALKYINLNQKKLDQKIPIKISNLYNKLNNIYYIEKLDDNFVTLEILIKKGDKYIKTGELINININNICMLSAINVCET